jgi:hypothetical protein
MVWLLISMLGCLLPLAVIDKSGYDLKCDSRLAGFLRQATMRTKTELRVIGECELSLNMRISQVLCDSGVTLLTTSGTHFIARGTPAQVRKLAQLRIVKRLCLSVTQNPPNDDHNQPNAVQ